MWFEHEDHEGMQSIVDLSCDGGYARKTMWAIHIDRNGNGFCQDDVNKTEPHLPMAGQVNPSIKM